jgi:hypothetical protein
VLVMMRIDDVTQALAKYDGWGYAPLVKGGRDCRYPIPFAPWAAPPPPRQTDCVTYVVGVVLGAARLAGLEVDWPLERHNRALIATEAQVHALLQARAGDDAAGERLLFGIPDTFTAAGLAELVPTGEMPPAWSVVQGWSRGWKSGHAVLISKVDGQRVLVREASKSAGRVRMVWSRWPIWTHARVARLLVE